MCGLFGGYSSSLTPEERSVVQTLMIFNFARGEDSTGMCDYVPNPRSVNPNESAFRFWKSTANPMDFARTKWKQADDDRWKKAQPRVIAGHSRAATRGKVIQNNAHPFYHKPIIGMHNGTIYGPFHNHLKFDTDSEALYANVAEMGIRETIFDLKSAHSVAYAMVWIDCRLKTLNFLRNDKRPLHFARQGNNGATLFWSSEALQLELATSYLKDAEKWEIMEVPVNKHYSFDLTENGVADPQIEELVAPTPVFIPLATSTGTNQSSGHYANRSAWGETEWDTYQKSLKDKGIDHTPWTEYPDYDEDDGDKPPQVQIGTEEPLSEGYLLQFSSKYKQGIFNRWDVASKRWLTLWGWHRLNAERRRLREANKAAVDKLQKEVDAGKANISHSDPLNDNVPDFCEGVVKEEAAEVESSNFQWETAAPWHVNGDVVDYKEWLQATKNGCTWERCLLIHNSDCVWVTKDVVLCKEHAEEALRKGSEIDTLGLFESQKSVIRNGLKNIKKRLANEISLRSAAQFKQSSK
jgi:hypothetical protein